MRQYFFCCCGLLRVKQGLVAGRRPLNQLDRKPVVIDLSCQVVFKGGNENVPLQNMAYSHSRGIAGPVPPE